MLLRLGLLAILAFCLVSADYYDVKTADKDFLVKQKKVYQLLYKIQQPGGQGQPPFSEGDSWIDSYTNTTAAKEFLYLYQYGMLPRGEIFSIYYPRLQKEFESLFRLFYYAKDFDTFYKTAQWAKGHVNEAQYILALYNAVLRRPDTKYIQLPPPYEVYPYAFYNNEVLEKAHHPKVFGKLESKKYAGYSSYLIPANYSGWYLTREYDVESKLNYFTEDIGLNAYYFYFRQESPFWLKSKEFDFVDYRGEEYLYGHKQLMSRYYLERLSNDIGKIEDFDWNREFYPGYYPSMTFHNGLPFPQRPSWTRFPEYKFRYIRDVQEYESRVYAAIDSGYIVDVDGKLTSIYTPEGLNILGNIIEGNADSCNIEFYGSIDRFARKILGYNLEPTNSHQVSPSALEMFGSSMRDPAFYRMYKRIFYFYYRYKQRQVPYNKEEVIYPNLKIESFNVDKLITYFDQYDSSIGNGLLYENPESAESYLIRIRQYRLNHKPYSFHIAVNAEKPMKAAVRIFLGPKYDVHRKPYDLYESFKYFYEIDNWIVDLNAGSNKIVRKSQDSFFSMADPEPSEIFYAKVLKALEGSEALQYNERVYGFPERLLLPKGKREGMTFQLFAYVSPVTEEPYDYTARIWGRYKLDKRPFGFPLDRPFYNYRYDGPNMMLKDVVIYHKDEMDLNVTY